MAPSNTATVTITVYPDTRASTGLQVLYTFNEGSGSMAYDQSNTGLPMDLDISSSVDWNAAGNGVLMSGGRIGTNASATKVIEALMATGQSTFEIWIAADNLTQSGPARVSIYDVGGRHIRTLVDEPIEAGDHIAAWDGRDADGVAAASGVYFLRLEAAGTYSTRKLTLLQ